VASHLTETSLASVTTKGRDAEVSRVAAPTAGAGPMHPEPASADVAPGVRGRLDSVDLLRGVVMILMALDHTRDYFGNAAADPTNLATTTAPLFLTRWVTHVCAPSFFLLAGVGAFLALRRWPTAELSRFLLTRGLWLVLLELTVMRFFWQFNADYRLTMLTVLWALGWSMVAMAAIVRLPLWLVSALGIMMIALHDLTDPIEPSAFGEFGPLWTILHRPGPLVASPRHFVFVAYPLVPWIGVMAVGYALGRVFTWPAERRRAFLLRVGVALTVAFVVLRLLNVYGDPRPWSPQPTAGFTLLSFLNTSKYPPSLLFLLMTLGPALLFLRLVEGRTPHLLRPALAIGRVPLFYYLLHVVLIHGLAVVVCYARYGSVHWMFESPSIDRFPVTQPPGWPAPLPLVYLTWLTVVALLYPCCRWYAAVKARRASAWLSYL
jgi:uncharacterized membrane protein